MRGNVADEARRLLLEIGQRELQDFGELLSDVHASGQLDARAVQAARDIALPHEAQQIERRAADRDVGRRGVVLDHAHAAAFGTQREIETHALDSHAETATLERFELPLDARRFPNGALEQPLGRGGQRQSHRYSRKPICNATMPADRLWKLTRSKPARSIMRFSVSWSGCRRI